MRTLAMVIAALLAGMASAVLLAEGDIGRGLTAACIAAFILIKAAE